MGPTQRKIAKENLPMPLLLVDGEVRIAGEFEIRQLIDAIEAVKEMTAFPHAT